MRLYVTDHAFVRMADWHPDFRQFVPKAILLDYPQALGVMNGLHVFLASLEAGRPSTLSEKNTRWMTDKYVGLKHFCIFDRQLRDLYTMVVRGPEITLVTVTEIEKHRCGRNLDDLRPPCTFADVDAIRVPYALNCALQGDPEFSSIRTPQGRELALSYDFQWKPKIGRSPK